MIHRHKLKRLSPDELTVLLYCVNDGNIESPRLDETNIQWAREPYAIRKLMEYSEKLSNDKKKKQTQDIANKLMSP